MRNLHLKTYWMNIEIITIGDELLIGQVVDTNSAWMSKKLSEAGFDVIYITSIKDEYNIIFNAIEEGFKRADVLLMTGGNGPTKDDITKNTLCDYFEDKLVLDNDVLDNIKTLFKHKNLKLNELTHNQAYVPQTSTVIQNIVGTAPNLWFEKNGKVLVSMPGVPFEMRYAMEEEIIPRLSSKYEAKTFLKHTIYTYGISESALAMQLNDFEEELPHGFALAYLPGGGIIRLRLSAKGEENTVEMDKQIDKLKRIIDTNLLIESEDSLEVVLGTILKSKKLSISLAESCSGGYLAHLLTTVSGASQYFKGSIVSYADSAKIDLLNVSSSSIDEYGAVSKQVVEEMAKGAISALNTDCAIAISGIAGPEGGTVEKPVGTVWICTIYNDSIISKQYMFGNSRDNNIQRSAVMAIVQLLKMIA
jgi:nicotinamide-nucleotide amidase